MKLGPLFSVFSATNAAGSWQAQHNEASEFLSRESRANVDQAEEFRTADLERECNEEACDIDEAMEIFEDRSKAESFMYDRLHYCEQNNPCYVDGSSDCVNKWNNYWCECKEGWYGKDCDFIDTRDGYMCSNPDGCLHDIPGAIDDGTKTKSSPSVYSPKVGCDVTNNKFRVELPAWKLGPMKMGLDVYTAECGATETNDQGVVFEYDFDSCGTRLMMDDGGFVYENHIGRGPLKINGVYRDLGMTYNVRCVIDRHGHVDNRFVNTTTGETGGEILPVYTMPDKIFKVEDAEGSDQYIFRLNVYHSEAYQRKFEMPQFPISMAFKEYVYLGVEVITKMEHQYIFTERCWATPNADPLKRSTVFYPIMDSGCPSDAYTDLEPRLDLEDRFRSQTLKFPNADYVYIQCDVIVCDMNVPDDPECQSTCRAPVGPSKSAVQRNRRETSSKPRSLVTVGPLRVRSAESRASESYSASSIASWCLAGGAFAALAGFVGYQQRKKSQVTPDLE